MVISFHKKENTYLAQINKGTQAEKNKLKLAGLYIDSKNYYLAKPILEELCTAMPESGEVYFHLGCVALQYNMLKEADLYFRNSIKYDPKFTLQIDDYKQELGETFLAFTQHFKTMPGRELSEKYMVKKGFKFHPDNNKLKREMEIIIGRDLEKIKSGIDANNYQEPSLLLKEWYQDAMDQKKSAC